MSASGRRWRVMQVVVVLVAFLAPQALSFRAADGADDDAAKPVIRVGTEGVYPPFTYTDPRTGELTGFDIEVVRAVAERAGWDLQEVEAPFDALFPALDSGRIELIANQVTINSEREARYLLTQAYTYSRGVIVTAAHRHTNDIDTLEDLEGKTAAASETSSWAQVARDAGARVEPVEGFAQAVELLVQGRVDVVVNDNIAVLDYLASTGSDDIQIVGEAGSEVSRQALVFSQSDRELRDRADEALKELAADGTLKRISEKYFAVDVTVPNDGGVEVAGSDNGRNTWQVVADTAVPMLLGLIKGTVPLTAISFLFGLFIALVAALARLSSIRLIEVPARIYISIIRGTPLLVQLFIVFYGLPELGIKLPGFFAACLALSLNVGGYAAEVVRASILSVPRGQFEAAKTIGMDYAQGLRRIVLPQAARIAVPGLSNTLLSLVKDTSLVAVVLVTELFREAQTAAALSTEFLALYGLAALYYWVICYLLTLGQDAVENRLKRFAI